MGSNVDRTHWKTSLPVYNASNGIMSFSTFYFTTVHFLSPYSRPVSVHGSSLYLIICLFVLFFCFSLDSLLIWLPSFNFKSVMKKVLSYAISNIACSQEWHFWTGSLRRQNNDKDLEVTIAASPSCTVPALAVIAVISDSGLLYRYCCVLLK